MSRTPTAHQLRKIKSCRAAVDVHIRGKLTADYGEHGHAYIFNETGTRIPSVTTKIILDQPHLVKWAAGMSFDYMETRWSLMTAENRDEMRQEAILAHELHRDEAGDVGTAVHDCIERYLQKWIDTDVKPQNIEQFLTQLDKLDSRIVAGARSAEASMNKYPLWPVAVEMIVGNERKGVAGRFDDLMYNLDTNQLELWDTKTSNQKSDKWALQVAAYAKATGQMIKRPVKVAMVRHLDKYSNKFKIYKIPDIDGAYKAFTDLAKVYDYWYGSDKKVIEDKVIVKL